MNCFSHPHNSAVGICRVCCKGVCTECGIDLGHSLACKGIHENDASSINALNLRSARLLKVTRKSIFIAPGFFALLGLFFLMDGLGQRDQFNFGTYMGATFIVFALATLFVNMRAYGGSEQSGQ